MKSTDFWNIPEGTVILVRPSGPGARDPEAQYEFTLGELGTDTRLIPSISLVPSDHPDTPSGFYPQVRGSYRAVTMTKWLSRYEPDEADENWRPVGFRAYRAVRPHDVIGVWAEVRDELIQQRREHFASVAAAEKLREQRHAVAEAALREAQAVVRPAMESAGFPESHQALSKYALPHGRTFTTEEVAQIIRTIQQETSS